MCVAHAHATRCARAAACGVRVRERPRPSRADLDGIIELVPPKYYFAAPEANAAPRKFQKHVGKPAQVLQQDLPHVFPISKRPVTSIFQNVILV